MSVTHADLKALVNQYLCVNAITVKNSGTVHCYTCFVIPKTCWMPLLSDFLNT